MDSEEIYKQAILFRRWLHRHPEVSTQEFQTQAFVIDVLKEYKIPYKTYGTGIIATLGEGADCVALRADMDALRVQEDTGFPYCSETSGLMHACGHDMHTAMLLGAAIILKSKEAELGGTLKLVFQPSEEKRPGGARLLLPHLLEPPRTESHIRSACISRITGWTDRYTSGSLFCFFR